MIYRAGAALAAAFLLCACARDTHALPVTGQPAAAAKRAEAATPQVKFFTIPTSFSWPEYITNGPDGNLWFTEFYTDKVARITTAGAVTEFALPPNNDVEAIVTGPDKNLWFTEPGVNRIGRITPSGTFESFFDAGRNPSPRGIAVGPDGNLWFAEYYDDHLGRITPSGTVTRFALARGSSPWEVIAGPDGDVWVTLSTTDRIARFNPATLKFDAPVLLNHGDNPWALTLDPDRHVWFTGRAGGKIGVVLAGKATEFTIPGKPGSYPDDIAFGPDGNFWFTESLTAGIGRFDPSTRTFLPRINLSSKDIPTSIVAGPDGNMWFTNPSYTGSDNKIGVVLLH